MGGQTHQGPRPVTVYDYLIALIIDRVTLAELPHKYLRIVASRERDKAEGILIYGADSIDGPWEVVELREEIII